MKGFIYILRYFWKGIPFIGRYTPFLGIFFLLGTTLYEFQGKGFKTIVLELGKKFVLAEYTIYENVNLAIINSPKYGFIELIEIVSAFFILWGWFKIVRFLLLGFFPLQKENFFPQILAFIIFVTGLELVYMGIIYQSIIFIPLWDGVIKLFLNIGFVWNNVWSFGIDNIGNNSSILRNITKNATNTLKNKTFS